MSHQRPDFTNTKFDFYDFTELHGYIPSDESEDALKQLLIVEKAYKYSDRFIDEKHLAKVLYADITDEGEASWLQERMLDKFSEIEDIREGFFKLNLLEQKRVLLLYLIEYVMPCSMLAIEDLFGFDEEDEDIEIATIYFELNSIHYFVTLYDTKESKLQLDAIYVIDTSDEDLSEIDIPNNMLSERSVPIKQALEFFAMQIYKIGCYHKERYIFDIDDHFFREGLLEKVFEQE